MTAAIMFARNAAPVKCGHKRGWFGYYYFERRCGCSSSSQFGRPKWRYLSCTPTWHRLKFYCVTLRQLGGVAIGNRQPILGTNRAAAICKACQIYRLDCHCSANPHTSHFCWQILALPAQLRSSHRGWATSGESFCPPS